MTTKLCFKYAGICMLTTALVLGTVLQAGGGEVIELRNERVAFSFSSKAGMGLTGISDLTTGCELLDLLEKSQAALLWNLRLFQDTELLTTVSNLADAETRHTLKRTDSGQILELFWEGIAVRDTADALKVKVTVERDDGSQLARWSMESEAHPPFRIWSADFPSLSGVRDLGDDYLAVPNYLGRIVHDPSERVRPLSFNYPGKWSMQFVAAWVVSS